MFGVWYGFIWVKRVNEWRIFGKFYREVLEFKYVGEEFY